MQDHLFLMVLRLEGRCEGLGNGRVTEVTRVTSDQGNSMYDI